MDTASSDPGCTIEFNIPANLSSGYHQQLQSITVHFDFRVFLMAGHLHMGGYNVTLYRGEAPDPDRTVCSVDTNYGTEVGVVGNERGFVANMTECSFREKGGFVMRKGERFTMEAIYNAGATDPQLLGAGYHDGVMAFAIMYGVRCTSVGCTNEAEPVTIDAC